MLKTLYRCDAWGKHKLVGSDKIQFVGMRSSGNYSQHKNGSANITGINSDVILAGFIMETGNT